MTDMHDAVQSEAVPGGADARRAAPAQARITSGALRGTVEQGVERYLGVPYAAAPFGELRFAAPVPHPGWAGERDASAHGPTAPQAPYGGGLERLLPTVEIPGDEILSANVWTPAERTASGRPVLVWIHGGSLAHGSNALGAYDGTPFARDGIVFVGLNYRLAAEGFSVLADAPLNLGLADVLRGLEWVREEIAAFGGDPDRVTVAGQSAGGNLVAALLGNPVARRLMRRAIVQSGPLAVKPVEDAGRITRLMAKQLGVPATRAGFASRTPAELVEAQRVVTAGSTPITGGAGFAIAEDGELVAAQPEAKLRDGCADRVELLIGATREEYRLWMAPTGLLERIGRVHLAAARLKFRISGRTVARYRRNRPGARVSEIFGVLATDLLLRLPLVRAADARATREAPTWVYEFDWSSPVESLGSAHAMELGFVFDLLGTPDAVAMTGAGAPQRLADEMHRAWAAFVADGDPGWPRWDGRRLVRVFGERPGEVAPLPRADEVAVWSESA